VPESASDAAAGGFAETFLTAYDALVVQAELRTGERLLISGAAGGVGTAAIQIGRLYGAHVIAVSRHPEHSSTLLALGADEVIAPEEVANLAPVHVLLELVGAANFDVAQHRLAPFARVVVIGVGGGATAALNLLSVMTSRASITGSTLRSRTHDEKAALCSLVRESLLPAWDRGELRVPIAQEFLATDVEAAFAFFAQPGKLGKVVLIHAELP
jgi:NADPH:quinone reductase-like Zn-dependent oxidoreductase